MILTELIYEIDIDVVLDIKYCKIDIDIIDHEYDLHHHDCQYLHFLNNLKKDLLYLKNELLYSRIDRAKSILIPSLNNIKNKYSNDSFVNLNIKLIEKEYQTYEVPMLRIHHV